MTKHQHGNKEAKKPMQARAVVPPVLRTEVLPAAAPLNRGTRPGKR